MFSRFEVILFLMVIAGFFIPVVQYLQDYDDDGVINGRDNCTLAANQDQANTDDDTFGDVCDICPTTPSGERRSRVDCSVMCTSRWYWYQADEDLDGIGDECDSDFDE